MRNKLIFVFVSLLIGSIALSGMEQPGKRAKKEMPLGKTVFYDITKLQEQLAAGADVHEADEKLCTPLHTFVITRRQDGISLLLLHGAAIGRANAVGNTPLHAAAHTNRDVATCLMVHPQGGPQGPTEGLRAWQLSIALFAYALKQLKFPRDIRLKICQHMLPEPHQLIQWAPLRYLPYYASLYADNKKHMIHELLIKRHLADVSYALNAKNTYHQTPEQLAKTLTNRMRTEPVPAHSLRMNTLVAFKPIIGGKYASLLDIQ